MAGGAHWASFLLVGCILLDACAPSGAISPSDYVEIERTACYGPCPVYVVRMQADGAVHWHGKDNVFAKGDRTASISPSDATAIVEEFRTASFWALRDSYSRDVTDSATLITIVHIADREKRVSDYASAGPQWLRDLDWQVETLVDTHRWRHGDPAAEKLDWPMLGDASGAKPGVTALMSAAGKNDIAGLQRVLKAGADVNAQDSSGWTALMYASYGASKGVAQALLSAGADARLRSLTGQTAVMAAARPYHLGEENLNLLLAARGDTNVQDNDGETALMAAIRHKRYDAAKDLRDAQGRNALDYLIAVQDSEAKPTYTQKSCAFFSSRTPTNGNSPPA
jgi:Domain of unknown function (DUF6438)/Ankyrin repeats (3 copies)/Ankyrin repeats (many copies)